MKKSPEKNKRLTGYPENPPSEEIYKQEEEMHIDSNEGKLLNDRIAKEEMADKEQAKLPPKISGENEVDDDWNEENFDEDYTGEDLDIPGAELDDTMENIGEEDEENNYYSLGGDTRDD